MTNVDPPPDKRVHYRHADTGELGYLVQRDGVDKIRLDRGNTELIRPFHPREWVPEHEHRPMTRQQAAQVAYEADRKLCFFLGLHKEAKREWIDLRDNERMAFVDEGPRSPKSRRALYAYVMKALEGMFA